AEQQDALSLGERQPTHLQCKWLPAPPSVANVRHHHDVGRRRGRWRACRYGRVIRLHGGAVDHIIPAKSIAGLLRVTLRFDCPFGPTMLTASSWLPGNSVKYFRSI